MNKAYEKFDLTGRTALITGSAGLLGLEHASALLESGATVVLTDINEANNAEKFKKLHSGNNKIAVPKIYREATSRRVLTLSLIHI